MDILNRKDLEHAAELFAAACAESRRHDRLIRNGIEDFGDGNGKDVSGIGRDHFPDSLKDELRRTARNVRDLTDSAYNRRPPRVHLATMRRLAQAVAKRDGSGFYGPQA